MDEISGNIILRLDQDSASDEWEKSSGRDEDGERIVNKSDSDEGDFT